MNTHIVFNLSIDLINNQNTRSESYQISSDIFVMAEISHFEVCDSLLKVALLPSQFEFPVEAVKQQLNGLLFRFHHQLQCVPIAYTRIIFPKDRKFGRIIGELPMIHIDIKTRLLVFRPIIGQEMIGRIIQVVNAVKIDFIVTLNILRIIYFNPLLMLL